MTVRRYGDGMRITHHKNFAAGVMYTLFGVATAAAATQYSMGTAARMGPGYFPFWTGIALALVGGGVMFGATRVSDAGGALERGRLKSLAFVLGSVIVFGLLLVPAGLVVAVVALVVVSSFASDRFSWRTTLMTAVVLVPMTLLIFVYGLNLSFPVLPAFLAD